MRFLNIISSLQNWRLQKKGAFCGLNQRGQAFVEYILVLFVIFVTALFFLQFSQAFNAYLDNYIKNYIACLLETGELPSLGVSNPEVQSGICNSQFEAFTLANGRPPRVSSSGSPQAGNTPQSGDSADDGEGADDGDSGGEGSGGGSSRPPRRVSQVTSGVDNGPGTGNPSSVPLTDEEKGNKEKPYTGSTETSSSNIYGLNGGRRRSVPYRAITGRGWYEEDEKKEQTAEEARKLAMARKEIAGGRAPRVPFNPPREEEQEADTGGGGFSLGNFIRYLLIAAIVIALFMFFGGQVAQVARGWERR